MTGRARRIDVWRPPPPPTWGHFMAGGGKRRWFLSHWIGDPFKFLVDFALYAALRGLPVETVSAFGGRMARMRGPTHYRREDELAAKALRRLQPHLDGAEIEAAKQRHWDHVGRLMTEFTVLGRLIPEGRVEVEGLERFEAARAGGRGVVMLGLHLGNWEVATPLLTSLGAPPTTFYEPPESRSREILSRHIRRRLGATLLPLGLSGFKPALQALAEGEAVVLFGDETRGGIVQAPFFGRPIHRRGNLALAVRLARQAGTVVQPGYVLRIGAARFRAVFLPTLTPGDDLTADVARLNALIEPVVRAHLEQWYYLHFPIWREADT